MIGVVNERFSDSSLQVGCRCHGGHSAHCGGLADLRPGQGRGQDGRADIKSVGIITEPLHDHEDLSAKADEDHDNQATDDDHEDHDDHDQAPDHHDQAPDHDHDHNHDYDDQAPEDDHHDHDDDHDHNHDDNCDDHDAAGDDIGSPGVAGRRPVAPDVRD